MTMRWSLIALVAMLALAIATGQAVACPTCYGSVEEGVLKTYYGTALMLSALPFGVMGAIAGIGWLLARPVPR